MRRSTKLHLGMTAAAALLALGCENVALQAINPISDDNSGEFFDAPSDDSVPEPGANEPGAANPGEALPGLPQDMPAPADDQENPPENTDPVVPDPDEVDPAAPVALPGVIGPHWPGPCIVVTTPPAADATGALSIVEFAYDDAGRTTDEWRDLNADTTPDEHAIQTYDADGRLASVSWDIGFDGSIDAVTFHTHEEGKRSRTLRDFDNDGIFDSVSTLLLGDDGRPAVEETDSDVDGIADFRSIFGFDAQGRFSFQIGVDLVNTQTVGIDQYTYDAESGRLASVDTDLAGDGSVDRQRLYAWTPEGYELSQTMQSIVTIEGTEAVTTDARTTWSRDEHGNILEAVIERFDGETSVRERYDYTCWE